MVAHYCKSKYREKRDRQKIAQEFASPQADQPRILIFDSQTLSAMISRSYMQGIPGATLAPPAAEPVRAVEKLALVIPTLCEAGNIGGLLEHVRSVLDPVGIAYEILVVDDDSPDGTGDVVSAMARQDPRVRLLVRKGKRGLSGAILYGWRNTDASILGVMDADLQHPPELLPQLLAAILSGRDMAIGSRYTPGGGVGEWSSVRRLLSAAAVWVTWPIQRRQIRAKDPMSGFFMLRRQCLPQADFQDSGFKLLLEILVRGRIHSIQEIPFAFGLRYRGASKANFKVAWDYALLLVKLYAGRFGFGRRA
jgi:dolichol-phosphate mannosyltransferase